MDALFTLPTRAGAPGRRGRPACLLLALLLTLALVGPARADELVVGNRDPSVQVTGAWSASSATPGFVGPDYLFRVPGDGSASVSWPFPAAAAPGRYELSARWSSGPNRASHATFLVRHAGGTAAVPVNQQAGGGAWQPLGSYEFQPGQGQGVSLSDQADGVVIANAIRWVGPASDAPAGPPEQAAPPPAAQWAVNFEPARLHAGPDAATDVLGVIPQFSFLQVLGYQGDFTYVYNPRTGGTAYIRSERIGPSDPPPAFVTADPPPAIDTINQAGRTVGSAPLAYYPVDDKWAYTDRLGHNTPVFIRETVRGDDGATWYRTDQGGYLAASSVRLPRPPERTYPGRWIDADLGEPAMLTAYEGDRPVLATLVIKGTVTFQTPTGVFAIQRRVADETMDSGTLGIPPNGPGGYHLEHVLFTQYFTPDGASIHYNYWSSNFGYAGSHGCLGLSRADSEFLWGWADLGTPVVIHS